MTGPDSTTAMVTALVRLRGALQEARLPLELPGAEEQRAARAEMVDQLEDYVIPRLMTLDAPLLAVVGGSTGAGKSTLVNSLVGTRVTAPGVLRPTTRSPVLVHHPDDARWFGQDRLLPELERVERQTNDPLGLLRVRINGRVETLRMVIERLRTYGGELALRNIAGPTDFDGNGEVTFTIVVLDPDHKDVLAAQAKIAAAN